MRTAPLGDIADFINGVAFKPEDWHTSGLPIIRIQNLTDASKPINLTNRQVHDKYKVRRGDILVSWSATLGVFTWERTDEALVNQHIFRVVPDKAVVEPGYLKHMLSGALVSMEQHLHGATMKHVNRGEFLATEIPLPPLDEQRRIAAILDQADKLRGKRGEILTHLNGLRASIFSEMFGDPVASSGGTTLAEVADIQIGPFGSLLHKEDYVTGGVPLVNPTHIVNGEIRADPDLSVTAEKAASLASYRLRTGDVVMGRRGEMGRCAIVGADHGGYLCGTGSLIVRPRPGLADSTYLQAALSNASTKSLLERLALGSTLPNLNAAIVSGLPIRTPPLAEQKKFRATLELLGRQDQLVQYAVDADGDLFQSLQHRAFAGQL